MAQRIKRLPAMQETQVRSLGWEDPLEKEMPTHSSVLAWRIPWTEEPERATVHAVTKSWTRLSDFTSLPPIYIPTYSVEGFSILFTVCGLSDDGHSYWCEVTPHSSFDMQFSNN